VLRRSLFLRWKPFKLAVGFLVAGPAAGVKLSGCIQVFRVVAFMDADRFLILIGEKKGSQACALLSRPGHSAVVIILAEGIVAHKIYS
jgi:hypothetical protein